MSVPFRIRNFASFGLLISLYYLFSGVGTAEQIVDTDPHVVLELGTRGVLPCRIQRRMFAVEWKRQVASESESLVSLHPFSVSKRYGPGYEAGMFNITDDHSLVIKDVKVQDEGQYFCSFSDYQTGITFRNSTRVSVQALPREPFPTIECVGMSACTLTNHSTLNLTCHVKGYYPDIDLFFLHGSENITSTDFEEWNNADGTKNKNIRVQISASDKPYQCVATRLPGMVGNRSVSVIVQVQDHPQTNSQDPNAAVIGVPVIAICLSILIGGICLSLLIAAIFRYHRGNGRDFVAPDGCISKLELWQLIKFAEENNDFEKLRKVVRRLLNTGGLTLETNLDFYKSLSTWKYETAFTCNQRENLYSVCDEQGMDYITRKLKDVVMDASLGVSKAILLHILWEIKEPSKITELLEELQLDHKTVATAVEQGRREVVYRAHRELVEWRKRKFGINPLVILSLKLDDLECETNFFKLSPSEMEDLDVNEMRGRSSQFSNQHVRHLLRVSGGINGEGLSSHIETLVQENHESLFDTIQMLQDWIQSEECSNYEIRKKLRKGAEASLQRDHTAVDKWPPDDELRVIASFLSPALMGPLCSKLGIKSPPQEACEEERFQALAKWRDSYASSKDFLEKHTEFITALKEVEREGVIPRVKGPLVYEAELVGLAFHLFAQDLLPFTQALGISAAKLLTYRPTFQPSHMTQGTIGLVFKLFGSGDRSHLLKLLQDMPYPNVFAIAMLAHEVGFGEVSAISVNPANSQALKRMQEYFTTPTSMPYGDDSFIAPIKKKVISPGIPTPTTTLLTSANQVEDPNKVYTESLAFLEKFKAWRELPRLSPFDFRLALAKRLGGTQDYYHQMSDFLRDLISGRVKGIIPFALIHNILHTIDPKQREVLGNLIRDAPFKAEAHHLVHSADMPSKDNWFELTEAASKYLYDWTNDWILEMIFAKGEKGEKEEIARKHKEFNDKLVDNGFLYLAREIMISEQMPIDASSFTIWCEEPDD